MGNPLLSVRRNSCDVAVPHTQFVYSYIRMVQLYRDTPIIQGRFSQAGPAEDDGTGRAKLMQTLKELFSNWDSTQYQGLGIGNVCHGIERRLSQASIYQRDGEVDKKLSLIQCASLP